MTNAARIRVPSISPNDKTRLAGRASSEIIVGRRGRVWRDDCILPGPSDGLGQEAGRMHPKRVENPQAKRPTVQDRRLDAMIKVAWAKGWWARKCAFRVRLFCSDCTGQDDYGCFGGSSELLHEAKHPWDVLTFETVDAAKLAGYAETADTGPWGFEIIDGNEEVVFATDV